jgi:hypothetical protein
VRDLIKGTVQLRQVLALRGSGSVAARVDDTDDPGGGGGLAEPAIARVGGIARGTVLRVRKTAVNAFADPLAIALGESKRVERLATRAPGAGNKSS